MAHGAANDCVYKIWGDCYCDAIKDSKSGRKSRFVGKAIANLSSISLRRENGKIPFV